MVGFGFLRKNMYRIFLNLFKNQMRGDNVNFVEASSGSVDLS